MNITASPKFQWMAGMLTTDGYRVLDVRLRYEDEPDSGEVVAATDASGVFRICPAVRLARFTTEHPELDLNDPATIGCVAYLMER